MSHPMIIFDDGLGQLGPMTDLRASFEVRTGMFTTAGRIAAHRPRTLAGYFVPPALAPVLRGRADAPVNELPGQEIIHCINGRWGLPDPDLDLRVGEALVESTSGHVVAAVLRRADAAYFLETGELSERVSAGTHDVRLLYRYPWDVIALMKETISHDILMSRVLDAAVVPAGTTVVGTHPVEIDRTARIYPQVVLDAEQGPIVIHDGAVIRPGAILCGPCSVGRGATVLDRALLKPWTVIGPRCKVAGEIGATIFQGYSNKAHDGHLGDSYVGRWVNFGAGTTNSNLLNTYGEVAMRVEPEGPRHRTGLTFLGAIVGDHAKFAIGTRIMTGTVVGTGAMIATTEPPPTTVRRFAWLTDAGARTYSWDRFLETARIVMERRGRPPAAAYIDRLRRLHEAATARDAAGA